MTRHPLASVRADALARWERSPTRSPFTHPAVMEAAGGAFGLDAVAWLGDGAAVVGLERRRLGARALAQPPALPYSPPLLDAAPKEADVTMQRSPLGPLAAALAARYAQATVALPPAWPDARPLAWNGWALATRYTSVARLDERPFLDWSGGARRRAQAHAGAFEVELGPAHVGDAVRLQVASYARKGLALRESEAALRRVADAMSDAGLVQAAVAKRDGAVEAAALFAVDGPSATYWLSGSAAGPAMTVLFAHAERELAAAGVRTLDLGGANVPGVAQFKRGLGGRVRPVVVARWARRWVRALQALRP